MAKTSRTRIAVQERRAEAVRLRVQGKTYRQISSEMRLQVSAVYRHVTKAMAEVKAKTDEDAGVALEIELARLDRYLDALEEQIKKGHLGAIDRALAISTQRAKLRGLYAPTRFEDVTPEAPLQPADARDLQAALLERQGLSVVSYAPPGSNGHNGGNGGPSRN